MGRSLESSRPMLSDTSARNSQRYSTLSQAPSMSPTVDSMDSSTPTNDPRVADIKAWNAGFDRLEQKKLQAQRFVPSAQKTADLSKLALGAKVERALTRRMTGQDAELKPKEYNEKTAAQ
ncbi:hypothetical protein L228DRAFT_243898 [Xylona heveae TC161]|uniref:Uncharacterized protein n=1 Tax=Xylona heveae (strain CBS 132557 / TC161) TaxID=1328760 RepID=A0A161TG63_XYLHT|nr:hypothetical protein L228DRAFT_243898 [Xylona heveae TC161]KZF25107.1 hypothetical protein L228DRAFT_243898 [Xylona heveae TC161]